MTTKMIQKTMRTKSLKFSILKKVSAIKGWIYFLSTHHKMLTIPPFLSSPSFLFPSLRLFSPDAACLKILFALIYNRPAPAMNMSDWQVVLRLARAAQKYNCKFESLRHLCIPNLHSSPATYLHLRRTQQRSRSLFLYGARTTRSSVTLHDLRLCYPIQATSFGGSSCRKVRSLRRQLPTRRSVQHARLFSLQEASCLPRQKTKSLHRHFELYRVRSRRPGRKVQLRYWGLLYWTLEPFEIKGAF